MCRNQDEDVVPEEKGSGPQPVGTVPFAIQEASNAPTCLAVAFSAMNEFLLNPPEAADQVNCRIDSSQPTSATVKRNELPRSGDRA